jgi:hypothetical protein
VSALAGGGPGVPAYLKTAKKHAQIRNRRFNKRDVEMIIKKVR